MDARRAPSAHACASTNTSRLSPHLLSHWRARVHSTRRAPAAPRVAAPASLPGQLYDNAPRQVVASPPPPPAPFPRRASGGATTALVRPPPLPPPPLLQRPAASERAPPTHASELQQLLAQQAQPMPPDWAAGPREQQAVVTDAAEQAASQQQPQQQPQQPPQQQQQQPIVPPPLMQAIAACARVEDAAAVYVAREREFDAPHLHALLAALAARPAPHALSGRQRLLLARLLAATATRLDDDAWIADAPPAALVAVLAALHQLGHALPVERLRPALRALGPHLRDLSSAQLAALICAATASAVRGSSGGSDKDDDAAAAVSAALSTSAATAAAPPAAPPPAAVVGAAWLDRFTAAFERHLTAKAPPAAAAVITDDDAHNKPAPAAPPTADELAAVITSLARLRAAPRRSWLYLFARHVGLHMRDVGARRAVAVASALASLGYALPRHIAAQVEREVGDALGALRPGEVADAVVALAVLRHRPAPAWTRAAVAAALRGSAHLSAGAAIALVAVAASGGGAGGGGTPTIALEWLDIALLQARGALRSLSAREIVGLVDALSAAGHKPGAGFMADYLAAAQRHLPALTLAQLSALLCGLAAAGTRPAPQWMRDAVATLLAARPAPNDFADLLRLLGALSRLRYTPPEAARAALEAHADRLALLLDFRQTAALRDALAALDYRDPAAVAAVVVREEEVEEAEVVDGGVEARASSSAEDGASASEEGDGDGAVVVGAP